MLMASIPRSEENKKKTTPGGDEFVEITDFKDLKGLF